MSEHATHRIYQEGADEIAVCRCGWWACRPVREIGAAESDLREHIREEHAR